MPRGSKSKYTSKQRRQVRHIEETGTQREMSPKRGTQMAHAPVSKKNGNGKTNGRTRSASSSRKGASKVGTASRGRSARVSAKAKHARVGRAAHRR